MRTKLMIFVVILMAVASCAPTAKFSHYDIYSHHQIVYNEDGVNELPPDILNVGESWVWHIGYVERTYRPRKKFDYSSTIVIIGNRNYEYNYLVKGKLDIRNGTRCYHMRENVDGEIEHNLIIGTKRFILEN